MRRELACVALATSLVVACFDEGDSELDVNAGSQPGSYVDGGATYADGAAAPYGDAPRYVLSEPSRGAAVALSPNEQLAVVVNRDVGSVSVLRIKYQEGQVTTTE